MKSLQNILTQIKDHNIVCPSPSNWVEFYKKIGGYEEKGDEYNTHEYSPMVLSGWQVTSHEDKHNRFINSLMYFYKKYPDKRDYIECFFKSNDNWCRWDDC